MLTIIAHAGSTVKSSPEGFYGLSPDGTLEDTIRCPTSDTYVILGYYISVWAILHTSEGRRVGVGRITNMVSEPMVNAHHMISHINSFLPM